jgi:hypothetical protein
LLRKQGETPQLHSRQIVARGLGDLPAALRAKLVRENVARLYNIAVPSPVEKNGLKQRLVTDKRRSRLAV